MTAISKYCTIQDLEILIPQAHLINLVIDRSGADIRDYDVIRQIEKYINVATADIEGELRRYRQTPFDPTITPLTGTFLFERGNEEVILTGGVLFELEIYDEFRPVFPVGYSHHAPDLRMIVKEVESDTDGDYILCWNVFYHEYDLEDFAASKYDFQIPKEVRDLVTGHCAFLIWERRTKGINNPMELQEERYRLAIQDIRDGKFRFERLGTITHELPNVTDFEAVKTFTDTNLRDYRPGDPDYD